MAQLTKGTAAGLFAVAVAFVWTINSPAQSKPSGRAVTLVEEPSAYTLSNGIVSARVDKNSGDLLLVPLQRDRNARHDHGSRRTAEHHHR